MKYVYCLRDNLSEDHRLGAPVLFDNDHQARRFLALQVPAVAIDTYSVLRVACFDEVTGQFENFEPQDVTHDKKDVDQKPESPDEPAETPVKRGLFGFCKGD